MRGMMHIKTDQCVSRVFPIAFTAISAITFGGVVVAKDKEGKVGKQQHELVGGTVVSVDLQRQYGLVTLRRPL